MSKQDIYYDLSKEYNERVQPIVAMLEGACEELGLPVTLSVITSHDADGFGVSAFVRPNRDVVNKGFLLQCEAAQNPSLDNLFSAVMSLGHSSTLQKITHSEDGFSTEDYKAPTTEEEAA